MKVLVLLFILGFVGCGKEEPTPGSAPVITATASTSETPSPIPTAVPDQFFIAWPENMAARPELLKKFGTSVLLVKGCKAALSYTLLSVGQHISSDTRQCQFEVFSDGTIQSY